MNEYINRDLAYRLIKEQREKETGAYSKGRNKGLIIAGSIINNKEVLPTADVVEVVRCKDFKHSCLLSICPFTQEHIYECLRGSKNAYNGNDFCSFGERKDAE